MRPSDWLAARVERERADAWLDLSHRIASATAGVEGVTFGARDVELVRWFRLVQLRRVHPRAGKQAIEARRQQLDWLFEALYACLLPTERRPLPFARL